MTENPPTQPHPRISIAAVAVIRRWRLHRTGWLAQWNDNWRCYNFVAGHKLPEESFLACVEREVSEELGLREGFDFIVDPKPISHVEFEAWSVSAQTDTHYIMKLFDVSLIGESSWQTVDTNPANRWINEEEIRTRRCNDGRPIGATMVRLFTELESRARALSKA